MCQFYTSWKHQKASGFLIFAGGKKWNIGRKWINAITIGYGKVNQMTIVIIIDVYRIICINGLNKKNYH